MAGEFAQRGFSVTHAQLARLLEGCEGVIDAGDGLFIGVDVEVPDRVVNELEASIYILVGDILKWLE